MLSAVTASALVIFGVNIGFVASNYQEGRRHMTCVSVDLRPGVPIARSAAEVGDVLDGGGGQRSLLTTGVFRGDRHAYLFSTTRDAIEAEHRMTSAPKSSDIRRVGLHLTGACLAMIAAANAP